MHAVKDSEKKFRWCVCPEDGCGKRYKQYAGAPLGACDECLGLLCDAFWEIWDAAREGTE